MSVKITDSRGERHIWNDDDSVTYSLEFGNREADDCVVWATAGEGVEPQQVAYFARDQYRQALLAPNSKTVSRDLEDL